MGKLFALIIEDDNDLAELFAMTLGGAGFDTEIALAGDIGMERLEVLNPDLVVLDLYLPNVGGADILERIRSDERLKETRVIVVTAGVRAAEVLQDKADLILVKPLDFSQLRDLAVRLCSSLSPGE